MKHSKILTIDNRGRIVIPQIIRRSLGLTTNSQLMLVADSETKEMKITPIGFADEKNAVKFRITMTDAPGALAKLASIFADLNLSMIYSEAVIVEKDKTAVWTVISERPPTEIERLKDLLLEKGAMSVEILDIESK